MSFTMIEAPQRSSEWFAARLGRLTGSRASDMLATVKTKGQEAAARRNLRVQLVLERITGRCQEAAYVSPAMQQGTDREPDAAALYEAVTGEFLTRTGFLRHDALMAGCSLDGHVGDFEGIIEIKSPQPAAHLDYLKSGVIPGDYLRQITHNLWISGAQWCDWLSFNPDFPEPLRVRLVRVERDEAAIDAYVEQALTFLGEVEREVDAVKTMADAGAVLREVLT
jgi:predicted phage-related endonuclease